MIEFVYLAWVISALFVLMGLVSWLSNPRTHRYMRQTFHHYRGRDEKGELDAGNFALGLAFVILVAGLVVLGVTRADAGRKPFHDSNKLEISCHAIVHRGMQGSLDEETVPSVQASAPYGFGAEVDARVALDGLVAVHDDRLTRISGGADDRQPETLTMDQLRQVELEHGGQLASIRQLVRAAKDTDAKLLIEGKRFPQHEQAWHGYGLDLLADSIRDLGMQDRVYVGGTTGFTNAFHSVAPNLRIFWRAEQQQPLTPVEARDRYASLVEADADRWTRHKVDSFRGNGIIPATRNANSSSDWAPAFDAGVRTFQTNRAAALQSWCRRQ